MGSRRECLQTSFFIVTCRYLKDEGYWRNFTEEQSGVDDEKCKNTLSHVGEKAEEDLKGKLGNCTIDDQKIKAQLNELSVLARVLAKFNELDEVKKKNEEIYKIIHEKCVRD